MGKPYLPCGTIFSGRAGLKAESGCEMPGWRGKIEHLFMPVSRQP